MEQARMWTRVLLGPGHSTSDEPEEHDQHGDEHSDSDTTLNLRIAAVFIILACGLIGGIPPLFSQAFSKPSHPLARLFRALSAGIILALALVHILPEAVIELGQLGDLMGDHPYNPAGACAVFGILTMVIMESAIHHFIASRMGIKQPQQAVAESQEQHHHHHAAHSNMQAQEHHHHHHHTAHSNVQAQAMCDPHTHVCMGSAHMMLDTVPLSSVRDLVLATMFELGCIFHSFIIGLTLGVNTTGLTEVRSLLIALSFHQWLEGIALGSFIMRAHISKIKGFCMVIAYSLTCPVGVAIGIGISNSYDAESTTAIATQGVFNGISGGMLLYIALVHLIAEDFSRRELPEPEPASSPDVSVKTASLPAAEPNKHAEHGCHHSHSGSHAHGQDQGWLLAASHTALFLGAAFMAMLGVWA